MLLFKYRGRILYVFLWQLNATNYGRAKSSTHSLFFHQDVFKSWLSIQGCLLKELGQCIKYKMLLQTAQTQIRLCSAQSDLSLCCLHELPTEKWAATWWKMMLWSTYAVVKDRTFPWMHILNCSRSHLKWRGTLSIKWQFLPIIRFCGNLTWQ